MKTDILLSYSRARRVAWAKLNDGNPKATRPPADWRHERHRVIMEKLHAGVCRLLERRRA